MKVRWFAAISVSVALTLFVVVGSIVRASNTALVRLSIQPSSSSSAMIKYQQPILFATSRHAEVTIDQSKPPTTIEIPAGRSVVELQTSKGTKKYVIEAPAEPTDEWVLNTDELTISAAFSVVDEQR